MAFSFGIEKDTYHLKEVLKHYTYFKNFPKDTTKF